MAEILWAVVLQDNNNNNLLVLGRPDLASFSQDTLLIIIGMSLDRDSISIIF